MENIKLCNKNNAIERVVFALTFEKSFDAQDVVAFKSIYMASDFLKESLPRQFPIEASGIKLSVNSGVPFPEHLPKKNIGMRMEFVGSGVGKLEWVMEIRENQIVIICSKYTRWNEILPHVENCFEPFIKHIDEKLGIKVRESVFQCQDVFMIDNPNTEWKIELFKPDSKYISKTIFEKAGYWHSYCGFFNDAENTELNKIEINHAATLKDGEEGSVENIVSLETFHVCRKFTYEKGKVLETISNFFKKSHDENYSIVSELLQDSVLDEMGVRRDDK